MDKPKAYVDTKNIGLSGTSFWIDNDNGFPYVLEWWGNGWVIRYQESYMLKDGNFKHKSDISGFPHSSMGTHDQWDHVFESKDKALSIFNKPFDIEVLKGVIKKNDDEILVLMDGKELPLTPSQHSKVKDEGLEGEEVKVKIIQYVKVIKKVEGKKEEILVEVPEFANKITSEIVKEEAFIIE